MKHIKKQTTLAPLLLLLAGSTAFAQTNGGTGKGLDQLDEQAVMSNLAGNNLQTLLDRDFANFKVPTAQQDGVKSLLKLLDLQNYRGNIAGRRALALTVANGLDTQIAKATDPQVLMNQANQLSTNGIAPVVQALEYFGENPVAQAQLKPTAEIAKKLYKQVAVLADNKTNVLAAGIKTTAGYNAVAPQLRKLGDLKQFSDFFDHMGSYSLCIALPKTDPKRKTIADETITYLKPFDDQKSTLQPEIRIQIGKFQLLKGDYDAAKATFDTVVSGKNIIPAPTMTEQNTGKYFGIVALIASRNLNAAEKEIPDYEAWQAGYAANLPSGEKNAVLASMAMLKFRLYSAQSDITNDAKVKQDTNDKAIDVLAVLLKEQPSLKDLVFDQLIGRIPENPDYKTLNPLILQGFQQQGFTEVTKPVDAVADEKVLNRAIDAAKELTTRVGQPGVDASVATLSAYFIAYAYDRMKDGKNAAGAFMDFAEKYPNDKNKEDAMMHAIKWVGELRKKDPADPDTRKLYDRFLPLAINPPFNHKEFAFTYAALLQAQSKFADAVKYFQMIPTTDKNYAASQYFQLLCLYKQQTEQDMSIADKTKIANQIIDLDKSIQAISAAATTPADKAKYVEWVVMCDCIAADLAHRVLKDPAKSLEILTGFEDRIGGSKTPDKAHQDALQLRISDYMDSGKTDKAVEAVQTLMAANPTQGEDLVRVVLAQVSQDMEKATDPADKKTLAQSKATLSGFVVDLVTKSKDPKELADLPIYQLDYAEAQQQAAVLSDDADAKKKQLQEARKTFQSVYDKFKDDVKNPNIAPQAYLDLGLVQFDLENYQAAVDILSDLNNSKKFGDPRIPDRVGGEQDNPQFWEGNFKLIKSLVELYKKTPTDPKSQEHLRAAQIYVNDLFDINGKHTGGQAYKDAFVNLRTEINGLKPAGGKPGK